MYSRKETTKKGLIKMKPIIERILIIILTKIGNFIDREKGVNKNG